MSGLSYFNAAYYAAWYDPATDALKVDEEESRA